MEQTLFHTDLNSLPEHITAHIELISSRSVLLLEGDMGTGKTTFVSHLAEILGVQTEISSPTFSIINIYPIAHQTFKYKQIVHMDLYRLEDYSEIIESGIQEYTEDPSNLCIIEWPTLLLPFINVPYLTIQITAIDENVRKFIIL